MYAGRIGNVHGDANEMKPANNATGIRIKVGV